jgi:hypothetical protein
LITGPEPGLAPEILPVTAPMVHVKVLGMDEVKEIFGAVPLQILAVNVLVTVGFGLTVTVIVNGDPAHDPDVEVGVTM